MKVLLDSTKRIGELMSDSERITLIEDAEAATLRDLIEHKANPQLKNVRPQDWEYAQFRLTQLERAESDALIRRTIIIAAWSLAATVAGLLMGLIALCKER